MGICRKMVRRYTHLSGGHLFAYARSMADNLDTVATNELWVYKLNVSNKG